MSCRLLYRLDRPGQLYELLRWQICLKLGPVQLFELFRGNFLCSDRVGLLDLRLGYLLCCRSEYVQELSHRHVLGLRRSFLHELRRGYLPVHRGLRQLQRLCRGQVHRIGSLCLLHLRRGQVLSGGREHLHLLCGRLVPFNHFGHLLFRVRRRQVLGRGCDHLLELCGGHLPGSHGGIQLRQLRRGHVYRIQRCRLKLHELCCW